MIRRIIRKRRPAPSLTGITLEEELALLRVELMYGLRVNREAYLRRKADEREELATWVRERDAAAMLAELRGALERTVPRRDLPAPAVRDLPAASGRDLPAASGRDLPATARDMRVVRRPAAAGDSEPAA
ncbi:hypothetical protein [Nonomuraea roseoviolacea]|uniref:Uncharacterized protein n=1 Tax=Nonomuraea roseoviolacea subsp. carminata TaxID=160689 RepID=A0ABT1K399_9ACTN|nr:hypothetical protein [Nonomuraea roseoviolacea]MCP2348448.1 hypothetical protein [Nonomuraea roseoviolacea subsp. carminata]